MDEIYVNFQDIKHVDSRRPTHQTGLRSSERRFHGAVVLCLGLLSVFLLAGLIGLGVHHRDSSAEFSTIQANLTERLQASDKQLSSLTEERDLLNSSLAETMKELKRLESLSKQKKTCPAGWKMFSCSCYLFSTELDSWEKARQDCTDRGADLVVVESSEEQKFLSESINQYYWIGLNDRDQKGTWKWIDGTALTQGYWISGQPDNGGGDPQCGEEDCIHILHNRPATTNWNDVRCDSSHQWICEKMP